MSAPEEDGLLVPVEAVGVDRRALGGAQDRGRGVDAVGLPEVAVEAREEVVALLVLQPHEDLQVAVHELGVLGEEELDLVAVAPEDDRHRVVARRVAHQLQRGLARDHDAVADHARQRDASAVTPVVGRHDLLGRLAAQVRGELVGSETVDEEPRALAVRRGAVLDQQTERDLGCARLVAGRLGVDVVASARERRRGGRPALHDRPVEEPARERREEQTHDVRAAGRLAEDRDAIRVAAEELDVLLHPLQAGDEIEGAEVAALDFAGRPSPEHCGMREPAEGPEAVVQADDDQAVLRGEQRAVVERTGEADGVAPAVDPDHDRKALLAAGHVAVVEARSPDVEVQTVLRAGDRAARCVRHAAERARELHARRSPGERVERVRPRRRPARRSPAQVARRRQRVRNPEPRVGAVLLGEAHDRTSVVRRSDDTSAMTTRSLVLSSAGRVTSQPTPAPVAVSTVRAASRLRTRVTEVSIPGVDR